MIELAYKWNAYLEDHTDNHHSPQATYTLHNYPSCGFFYEIMLKIAPTTDH